MRVLGLSLTAILVLMSITFGLASADQIGGPVYFMKTNSTAKLYTELTFRLVEGSWAPYPEVFSYPPVNGNYVKADSITIRAEPNSFAVTQPNVNVTYAIITKNDTKGTFEIFTGSWGYSYPLVVGLNESEVNPKIFYNFQPINCVFCPAFHPEPPSEKVVGYSGLVLKIPSGKSITWNSPQLYQVVPKYPETISPSEITGNRQQSSTVPEFSFAIPILIVSITSLIVFNRTKIRK